ncbi:hypothetical protein X924_09025 [Petrotoga sp. 9PWA.NaAc.5.4]|nr:hypothetical protein X924_09025 [Petrotoga sp. 9PWA.NaAc.5.4]
MKKSTLKHTYNKDFGISKAVINQCYKGGNKCF